MPSFESVTLRSSTSIVALAWKIIEGIGLSDESQLQRSTMWRRVCYKSQPPSTFAILNELGYDLLSMHLRQQLRGMDYWAWIVHTILRLLQSSWQSMWWHSLWFLTFSSITGQTWFVSCLETFSVSECIHRNQKRIWLALVKCFDMYATLKDLHGNWQSFSEPSVR